jgi:AP2-like factor (euAP2 lineage)
LTDVPPQSPLRKSSSKDGASKYQGVYFDKASNKWKAHISIEGKLHYIGSYDNEEEAAIDYARAVSKYCPVRAHQQWKQGK